MRTINNFISNRVISAKVRNLLKKRDYESEFTRSELETLTLDELKDLRWHIFHYVSENLTLCFNFLLSRKFVESKDNNNEFEIFYTDEHGFSVNYHNRTVFDNDAEFALLGSWMTKIENSYLLYQDREKQQKELQDEKERKHLIQLLSGELPEEELTEG